MARQARTYERAVSELVEAIFDATDIAEVARLIEHGLTGVRQMPNAQLRAEWRRRFDAALHILDPQSNVNGDGDPADYEEGTIPIRT